MIVTGRDRGGAEMEAAAMAEANRDLAQTVLAVIFLGLLIALSLWVLAPFLPALIWATMVVVATWPILIALQRRLRGRRWAAAAILTTLMLLLLIVPFVAAIGALVGNSEQIAAWISGLQHATLPPPPGWVDGIPFAGERIAGKWAEFHASPDKLAAIVVPHAQQFATWLLAQFGSIGMMLVHFLLVVVGCALLYVMGESAALGVRRFAQRLAGVRGVNAVTLAGQAIRGVAMGVVVTAIVQSLAAGVGLWIAGIPFAALLTGVIFLLGVAQLGPILVMLPAVAWLFWSDQTGMGTFLLVWTIVVGALDNFLRPVLIRRGADLPLLLIFAGVIGGLISFGLVGVFVGPVVLAVTYTLLDAWISDKLGAVPAVTAVPAAPAATLGIAPAERLAET
jgi:predicted PurR-regulated permease PerM